MCNDLQVYVFPFFGYLIRFLMVSFEAQML